MDDTKAQKFLKGKRILIVDDEEDIIETLSELLMECRLDRATQFQDAKAFLETGYYDIVVLDIMGVNGHGLLEIAVKRGFPTVMLTAHALSEEDLQKSFQGGASYYIPKDQITDIPVFLADVLKAIENDKNPWSKWFDRLGSFFDRKFGGTDWREKEKGFWEKERKKLYGR